MECESLKPISPDIFSAMQSVNIEKLSTFSEQEIRPVLPCLVRMALCAPVDSSEVWKQQKKGILKILSGIDTVNGILTLLSIDFRALEQDSRKEQQLRAKIGGDQCESILISQLDHGITQEFEQSDADRNLRLVLSELLFVISQMREPRSEFYVKTSELIERKIYLSEVADALCIAYAELPNLLPIAELSEALLHLKYGGWLLCTIVGNSPDIFMEACRSLVLAGEKQDEESAGGRRRREVMQMLCSMNPSENLHIRQLCVNNCTLPGLTVALTLKSSQHGTANASSSAGAVDDLVSFVSGLLLGSDQNVRTWFSQFLKSNQKRKADSMLLALRQHLVKELKFVSPANGNSSIDENNVTQACSIIRLYSALKGIVTLKLTAEEITLLLNLVTSQVPCTAAGARFVMLAFCLILSTHNLISSPEEEDLVIGWVRWLMDQEKEFEQRVGTSHSYGQMLFLVAIHFHSNQTLPIADLVSATLGMKTVVKASSLAKMRQLFTQEIFTEQVITNHAVTVPVTLELSANIQGFLPVHCIFQLLKNRTFSKYRVVIKPWIYKQLCNVTSPLHPLLPPLIEAYVNSIIILNTKSDYTNEPISNSEILQVFADPSPASSSSSAEHSLDSHTHSSSMLSQLLIVYYVLQYEDCRLTNMRSIAISGRNVKTYSEQLLSELPINSLLHQCRAKQLISSDLQASLLRLVATHYPHLCLVDDWLEYTVTSSLPCVPGLDLIMHKVTPEKLQLALNTLPSSSPKLLCQLETLLALPCQDLLPYTEVIVKSIPTMLGDVPRKLVDMMRRLWFSLHALKPRSLRLMTVNILRLKPDTVPYTQNDITIDPLVVLRCDDRVFRHPAILEIILRVLSAYMQAARVYLTRHIQANPLMQRSGQVTSDLEREELKNALITTQESAAVQILLESCLPVETERGKRGHLSSLREVQCLICSHLHQMFIADPNLAKLVHFQGYPSELLPLTVTGIPSMHICIDFIQELISQPSMQKQIFAVELTSHLCMQYALSKTMSIAKMAINTMFTLLEVFQKEDRAIFFLRTVPSLPRICSAFPPLCEDITTLLTHIGRVCISHMAVTTNRKHSGYSDDDDSDLLSQSSMDLSTNIPKLSSDYTNQVCSVDSDFQQLYYLLQRTFKQITETSVTSKGIY